MSINRRTLLQTVALTSTGSLAGCLESGLYSKGTSDQNDDGVKSVNDSDSTPAPLTPGSGFPRKIRLESVDDTTIREEFGIGASVRITEPLVTATHTASIEIELTNLRDAENTVYYDTDPCRGIQTGGVELGETDSSEIAAVPFTVDTDKGRRTKDCWGIPDPPCQRPPRSQSLTLEAGEAKTWNLSLYATEETVRHGRQCMPPGEYRHGHNFRESERGRGNAFLFYVSIEKTP